MRTITLAMLATAALGATAAKNASAEPVTYDWTGFYFGAHLGYGWGHHKVNSHTTISAPNVGLLDNFDQNVKGAIGGVQVGYNLRIAQRTILGIEIDASSSDIRGQDITRPAFAPQNSASIHMLIHSSGTVRARLGYEYNNVLIYGTGGLAWADAERTRTQLTGQTNNATPGTAEAFRHTSWGWTAGGGIEITLTRRWTTKIEYLYLDVGPTTATNSLSLLLAPYRLSWSEARIGVNYKF